MGFGKFLLGGLGIVGAIIAAAGAAAAAGVAAAGAAAVTGATAIGTQVGLAAGNVGLSSLAAITAAKGAGATAVGAITASGVVTAPSTASGIKDMHTAKEIVEDAEYYYEKKKKTLDTVELSTNKALDAFGEFKLTVWSEFEEFCSVMSKIKNCPFIDQSKGKEKLTISKAELDQLEAISISAKALLTQGTVSMGTGALAGYAMYGGTMAMASASTGTAISSLSGVAATNATMAALGGGSLATGGLGMAGGSVVLGTLALAPALAVGGLFLAFKGSSKMKEAREIKERSDSAIKKMDKGIALLSTVNAAVSNVTKETGILFNNFKKNLSTVKHIIEQKTNFGSFTESEGKTTEICWLSAKILKELTMTDLLVMKNNQQALNKGAIGKSIQSSSTFRQQHQIA